MWNGIIWVKCCIASHSFSVMVGAPKEDGLSIKGGGGASKEDGLSIKGGGAFLRSMLSAGDCICCGMD